MTLQTAGPGKTAPKLYHDFQRFDPKVARPNVLLDHAPPQGEGPQPTPHHSSCRHEYATKPAQSILPSLDLRPDGSTGFRLAVVCKRCRIHADVKIDTAASASPCPTSASPVHHFQLARDHTPATPNRITYDWQCSVEECRCRLSITYRLPRLRDADKDNLTSADRLNRRYEALLAADPEREGLRKATDMEALTRLRRYVHDALDPKHTKRQFPANNKRFQEAFGLYGRDCHELFESLGFKYAVSSQTEHVTPDGVSPNGQDAFWNLPAPEQLPDRWTADGSSERELLEDAEVELLAFMQRTAAETGALVPNGEGWPSADRDIERTFAAQGYQRYSALRRPSNEELPFFNSLGALADFGDSLIEFCYDRQTLCDPERASYYFECLQVISSGRNSEQLQMKVAMLESENVVSRRDINAAFSALDILPRDRNTISEEDIIGRFQSLVADQAPAAQQRSREYLYKIGVFRNSTMLINASRQTVETYEDALNWLGNGVSKDTPDESLLAVYGMKIDGSPGDEETGKRAVSVIAKERKSNYLNNWLLTGRQDSDAMTVDEALRHLNIEQKLEEMDQTILPVLFDSARLDRPGDMTEKAIATIQNALTGAAASGATGSGGVQHAPATWPVGLRSHGNTCYLNSLLQFYFSIQPLRDIILKYEKYELDGAAKSERVGNAHVTSLEILGGKRFAQDMKQLFQKMIHEPGATVRPEDDLVCRAFLDPQNYHEMGPAANAQGDAGTDGAGEETTVENHTDADTAMENAEPNAQSTSSSQTLQGDTEASAVSTDEKILTPPASPEAEPEESKKEEPENKPPLPPRMKLRRHSTVRVEALKMAEDEAKKQQDVADVHDKILWRLRLGMRPDGADPSGEQRDPLRDLFSIGVLETTTAEGSTLSSQPKFEWNVISDVPKEDTDTYSALDAFFDPSQASQDSKPVDVYKSIKALPPMLQISIPRIDWGPAGGFKSLKMIRLQEEIFLDRYTDHSHPSTLAKRKEAWMWKKQLRALREERVRLTETGLDISSPTAFSQTAQYLAGLDEVNQELESIGSARIEADGDITSALETAALEQTARLTVLNSEIDELEKKIAVQFQDLRNIKYRLAAVFFHRGSTGSGHYWTYIRDFQQSMWRKYNDETVEEQTKLDDILAANSYAQGTPMYVVYVADDKLDLVQPVCRDPDPAAERQDTQMGDVGWGTVDASQWETTAPAPAVAKPKSQMEALDPRLMDATMVDDVGEQPWDDQERKVAADAKW